MKYVANYKWNKYNMMHRIMVSRVVSSDRPQIQPNYVTDRGTAIHNTESMAVDHNWWRVWKIARSMHVKDFSCGFQKMMPIKGQYFSFLPLFPIFQLSKALALFCQTPLSIILIIVKLVLVMNMDEIFPTGR